MENHFFAFIELEYLRNSLPQIKFPMSVELKRSKICTKKLATLRILIPKYNQSSVDPEKKVHFTRRHH